MHVHRVVDDHASALGAMIFDDGGNDRRFATHVHRLCRHGARRIDHVQVTADARQRLFHTLELAHRHLELLAHAAVSATGARGHFYTARRTGRQ